MNLKDILNKYQSVLADIYDDQESLATFYIVAHYVSGLTKSQVAYRLQDSISIEEVEQYSLILERLLKAEPLQYVLSEAYFYGLKFKVNSAVLIPRPETEELVELALNTLKNTPSKLNILDIGTGSGCIAITLKHSLSNADVYAMDISPEALDIANQNAINNNTKVHFLEADIRAYKSNEKFDLIISNPPYVTNREGVHMDKNVMNYEPHLALFVADDSPLEFYIAITAFASQNLNKNGFLFFEINANFGKETANLLIDKSFTDIQILKDMQGKDRFISARKGN
jgi:release factor glutamine methyltransferase